MFDWLKKLFRPPLPKGEQYVEDTPQGKLYASLWKRCPDCGVKPPIWVEGPGGGACTNIYCGKCGEGYNVAPIVQFAEKIGQSDRYILPEHKK
jgi:hypothetical protein